VVQVQKQGLKGPGLIAVQEKQDRSMNRFCSTPCTTY